MKAVFDGTEYEFDPRRLGSLELIGLKRSCGFSNRMKFVGSLISDDIEAVVALRWILARRDGDSTLKFSDAPTFDSYDVTMEPTDFAWVRAHMAPAEIKALKPDEREFLGFTDVQDVGGDLPEASAGVSPGTSLPSPKQVFGPGKSAS